MKKTQTVLYHSFYEDFQCVGGPCSLSCCRPGLWEVPITKENIKRYQNLKEPFRTEVLNAIDIKKGLFKSRGQVFGENTDNPEYCAVQTDDGWCKLVLNCGDESLGYVCATYPRSRTALNDVVIYMVDVTCPEVAKKLFNDASMTCRSERVPSFLETFHIDDNLFSEVLALRDFLMDLFLGVEGYEAGKCFILFDLINSIQPSDNSLGDFILKKYDSRDMIDSVLKECEKFTENMDQRVAMMTISLKLFSNILRQIPLLGSIDLPDMAWHIDEWMDGGVLKQDMEGFYTYSQSNFPGLLDKFLAYRVFQTMFTNGISGIASELKIGYVTILFDIITAMSFWKTNGGNISIEEYSLIISSIERKFFHSDDRKKVLGQMLDSYEKEKKFSLFLLPVY